MARRRSPVARALARSYAIALIAFLVFPILVVLPLSFSGDRFLTFPPTSLSLRWYENYFNDRSWLDASIRSVRIGIAASLLSTVSGTLMAVWLSRRRGWFVPAIQDIALSPAIIPNVLIALGVFLVVLVARQTNSELALIAAHAMLGLPFVVLITGSALADLDPTLERTARVMGAGPVRAFLAGTWPSILPAVVSSALFAFFTSFDELIVALFTMSGSPTLPVRMWTELRFEIDPTMSAVSMVLIAVTTLGMGAAEYLRRRKQKREA